MVLSAFPQRLARSFLHGVGERDEFGSGYITVGPSVRPRSFRRLQRV